MVLGQLDVRPAVQRGAVGEHDLDRHQARGRAARGVVDQIPLGDGKRDRLRLAHEQHGAAARLAVIGGPEGEESFGAVQHVERRLGAGVLG